MNPVSKLFSSARQTRHSRRREEVDRSKTNAAPPPKHRCLFGVHPLWCFPLAGIITALLAAPALISNAAESAAPETGPDSKPPRAAAPRVRFSPAVAGIVKMVDAKVAPDVIKAYIANSPTTFDANVEEIIALKEHGIPDDIVTAMLAHNPRPLAAPQTAAQPGVNAPAQAPTPPPEPVPSYYPSYPAMHPEYSYVPVPAYIPYGPLKSFNNSKPIWVNGNPVWAGYYVPGYGILW
jgi:hypothetical protein